MWLMIEALDVWMFRDGKPFDRGVGHSANSLFPPTAFTLQGMLRSLAIDRSAVGWDDYGQGVSALTAEIGDPRAQDPAAQLGTFWMHGPYLARWSDNRTQIERCFPLPADVVRRGRDQLHVLHWSDSGLDLKLEDESPDPPLWLLEGKFGTLYAHAGQFDASECLREEDLFMREYRSGNAIDSSMHAVRADEGMVYSASFIRPVAGVGLLVELSDTELWMNMFSEIGAVEMYKLGGEGRPARIERVHPPIDMLPKAKTGAAKLMLITPAYFVGGIPAFSGITSRSVPRPLAFGGWDLARRRSRPLRRYAPPGSVFSTDSTTDVPELFTEQPDGELPLTKLGFGEYLRIPYTE